MSNTMRGIGYYFWRGAIAGGILGMIYTVILFVTSPGSTDTIAENIAAGAVFGVTYGAIIGLVTSFNTGLIVGMFTGITTQRTPLMIVGGLLPAAAILVSSQVFFAGPVLDPFLLGIALLMALINAGLTWMFHRHYAETWAEEAKAKAKARAQAQKRKPRR